MMTIPERVHSAQGRILVVDDDARMREDVLRGLQTNGYEVEGAEDGLEALRHLQHAQFDVVLTDPRCPVWMALPCFGRSVARALRPQSSSRQPSWILPWRSCSAALERPVC